jgi:hypothetical protein
VKIFNDKEIKDLVKEGRNHAHALNTQEKVTGLVKWMNSLHDEAIEDQNLIQATILYQFQTTKKVFYSLFWAYAVLFCLPFLYVCVQISYTPN